MYLYGNVGSEWVDDQWASSRHLFWLFFVEIVEDIVEDTAPLVEAAAPLLLVWWGWSRSRLLRCMDIVLLGATARSSAASVARLRSLML